MKKLTGITIILFLCASFNLKSRDELYINYVAAINNAGTFQYHVVIKLKNLNTGVIREVCTQPDFLEGALHLEYNLDYDYNARTKIKKLAIKNKDRYFEFKNYSAIANVGVEDYSIAELEKLEKEVNFDSIVRIIKKKKDWAIRLDEKELIMYAHALFNRGILTGENNCLGGKLIYVNRNNPPF